MTSRKILRFDRLFSFIFIGFCNTTKSKNGIISSEVLCFISKNRRTFQNSWDFTNVISEIDEI